MKTILIICWSCIAMCVASVAAYAQSDTCTPDCPDDYWMGPYVDTFNHPTCLDCIVQVIYYTRTACGLYHDMQIVRINTIGTGCFVCSSSEIFQGAIEYVLKNIPTGFPDIQEGACVENWRISAMECWTETDDGEGTVALEPCNMTACCAARYNVCRDRQGVISVTTIAGEANSDDCNTLPGCFPICDWLEITF